jgi:hypothetical protein
MVGRTLDSLSPRQSFLPVGLFFSHSATSRLHHSCPRLAFAFVRTADTLGRASESSTGTIVADEWAHPFCFSTFF